MPKMDGIQATRQIATTTGLQHVRILMLTTYDTNAYVFAGLQAGASGCDRAQLVLSPTKKESSLRSDRGALGSPALPRLHMHHETALAAMSYTWHCIWTGSNNPTSPYRYR